MNVAGTRNVSVAAATQGLKIFYTSTDYVFDGAKKSPYTEADAPRPLNHYAAGKLAGEQADAARQMLDDSK